MKKPVIYGQELHRPIEAGETLDPSAIPISSEAGNIMTVEGDGLYVPSPNLDDLPEASVSEAGVILLASAAEAQALSNTSKAVTPSTLGAAMNSHVLGMGQTWQDFTNSREINTTYTNTTGRPIIVSIGGWSSNEGADIILMVDNLSVAESFTGPASTGAQVTAVVPNGSYYRALPQHGEWTISSWMELR